MMRLISALLVCAAIVSPALAERSPLFPRPPDLEPDVGFWVRVYTEVDTDSGLVHDARNLGVVYDVVRFEENMSRRAREARVKSAKKRYAGILETLAGGKRRDLTSDEARVLALWGDAAGARELRAAAGRLRFQLGQADRFRDGLGRAEIWGPHVRQTLADMGLPKELSALPHVESSYNPLARSHAGAAGLWQFTRRTGLRFMRIDHVVDERLDPLKSTAAAARLLEYNRGVTGTWPLALTAYNHGAGGMRRAVQRLGTRDIDTIVRKYKGRSFGFASRNFYVSFLAALEVSSNRGRYFDSIPAVAAPDTEAIVLPAYLGVAALEGVLGVERDVLRKLNPSLQASVWEGSKRVPQGFELRVPRASRIFSTDQLLAAVPAEELHDSQIPDRFYKVRRGDTLSRIASYYDMTIRELEVANGLHDRHRIRIGQVLRLPVSDEGDLLKVAAAPLPAVRETYAPAEVSEGARAAEPAGSEEGDGPQIVEETPALSDEDERTVSLADPGDYSVAEDATIEVQAAETLGHYADWLGLAASRLRRLNGIGYSAPVIVGRRVRLDFSNVSPAAFEQKRIDHHRELQEAFFARNHIEGVLIHKVRAGDNLWKLSKRTYKVPIWLLRQYNPDVDFGTVLAPGSSLKIPRLVRAEETAPDRTAQRES